jgi:hypothetical protein
MGFVKHRDTFLTSKLISARNGPVYAGIPYWNFYLFLIFIPVLINIYYIHVGYFFHFSDGSLYTYFVFKKYKHAGAYTFSFRGLKLILKKFPSVTEPVCTHWTRTWAKWIQSTIWHLLFLLLLSTSPQWSLFLHIPDQNFVSLTCFHACSAHISVHESFYFKLECRQTYAFLSILLLLPAKVSRSTTITKAPMWRGVTPTHPWPRL